MVKVEQVGTQSPGKFKKEHENCRMSVAAVGEAHYSWIDEQGNYRDSGPLLVRVCLDCGVKSRPFTRVGHTNRTV
jgi:hypothetical protein